MLHRPYTPEVYTLSLHDALPISAAPTGRIVATRPLCVGPDGARMRLLMKDPRGLVLLGEVRSEEHTSNSSHTVISYAVFCLKKKKRQTRPEQGRCDALQEPAMRL